MGSLGGSPSTDGLGCLGARGETLGTPGASEGGGSTGLRAGLGGRGPMGRSGTAGFSPVTPGRTGRLVSEGGTTGAHVYTLLTWSGDLINIRTT